MFKEGNLLKFSPFIFKNGACPKNKFFVVLKEAENAMILAPYPLLKTMYLPICSYRRDVWKFPTVR